MKAALTRRRRPLNIDYLVDLLSHQTMKATAIKLGMSLATFLGSFPMLRFSGWFGVGILVGLVLSVLYWFDFARELRNAPAERRALRIVGLLMGLPQALFGVLCVGFGLAVVAWVIYNTFVERQPEYTGGFLTLGMGPTLVLFGLGWILSAFRRDPDGSNGP